MGSNKNMQTLNSIFIVDDDDIYVFTAKKMLSNVFDVRVLVVFENSKTALEALIELNDSDDKPFPELILLDLNMPIWDGWYFLDQIKKVSFIDKLNIFIVTSSENPSELKQVQAYEFVKGFISKPLTYENMNQLKPA